MVSFGTAAKVFPIFMSYCLPQLLIIKKGSPLQVSVKNLHMVYSLNMYPLDGKNVVRSFSKMGERFLFPHEISLEQILILHLNKNDKRKHHRILKNLHFTMNKFDTVGYVLVKIRYIPIRPVIPPKN